MFIDTHCHIDSYEEHSGETLDVLLERLAEASKIAHEQNRDTLVTGNSPASAPWSISKATSPDSNLRMPEAFIHVACDPKDFERGKELSEKYANIYTAYGIHPEYVLSENEEDERKLVEYLKHPKCVACGEFGLDYHYGADTRLEQMKLFERHLQIGLESKKPLVLHLREADEDALGILRNADIQGTNIHVHCFTGSPEFCAQILDLKSQGANIFVGFTGIVTFKNAQNVRDAAALVPLDQILLETDAPYMSPQPQRGTPCHSGFIPYIAYALAQVKQVSIKEIYKKCRENTRHCYGI